MGNVGGNEVPRQSLGPNAILRQRLVSNLPAFPASQLDPPGGWFSDALMGAYAFMLLLAGFFVPRSNIPPYWIWFHYGQGDRHSGTLGVAGGSMTHGVVDPHLCQQHFSGS